MTCSPSSSAAIVGGPITSPLGVAISAPGSAEAGTIRIEDPETATRLLLGALTRGAMLIANAADPVETRHAVAKSIRTLLSSFSP